MSEQQPQQQPVLAAYADANQQCRDIAANVGIDNCESDPDWQAANGRVNDLYDQALTAGHSVDEILEAGRER